MIIRLARLSDAEAMSRVLTDIIAVTKRQRTHDQDFVRDTYINNPHGILCSVAEDANGEVLGFQSLIRAAEGNKYGVSAGWGIIGTHVSPRAARRGVGKALFSATKLAAENAGLQNIDATIGADNTNGLAYYDAIGFQNYRTGDNTICKRFSVF